MESIIKKIANDVLMEHLNIPMIGTLDASQKSGSYAVLDVPQDFVDAIYEAIKEDGMEKPDDNAHISVMTDEELNGVKPIEEDGNTYEFKITSVDSVEPFGWDEMERVWFVRCLSPQLEELREKYGLTPLMNGGHNFHITVAVKLKKREASEMDKKNIVDRIVLSEVSQERKKQMEEYYRENKNQILRDQKDFREKYPTERREKPGGVSMRRRKGDGSIMNEKMIAKEIVRVAISVNVMELQKAIRKIKDVKKIWIELKTYSDYEFEVHFVDLDGTKDELYISVDERNGNVTWDDFTHSSKLGNIKNIRGVIKELSGLLALTDREDVKEWIKRH